MCSSDLAATQLPDRSLLVPALAAAGIYAAVLGVTGRRDSFTVAAPLILCAAWLTYATDALTGNSNWITVPVGVTILIVGGVLRAALGRRGEKTAQPATIAIDYVGIAFTVSASLVDTATTDLWFALLAIALGLAIAVWGAASKIRRRVAMGSATVVAALLLLVDRKSTRLNSSH